MVYLSLKFYVFVGLLMGVYYAILFIHCRSSLMLWM